MWSTQFKSLTAEVLIPYLAGIALAFKPDGLTQHSFPLADALACLSTGKGEVKNVTETPTVRNSIYVWAVWLSHCACVTTCYAADQQPAALPQAVPVVQKWEDDADDITLYLHSLGERVLPGAAPAFTAAIVGAYFYLRRRREAKGQRRNSRGA